MHNAVYLAARFDRRVELRRYRDALIARGVRVTSRWIDLDSESAAGGEEKAATMDLIDLLGADTVIAFSEADPNAPGAGRGGRHVEFGIAVGVSVVSDDMRTHFKRRFRIVIVGPREHVFHHLKFVERVETWEDALALLIDDGEGRTRKAGRR